MEKTSFFSDGRNAAEFFLTGRVVKPEDSEYDEARKASNRRFDKHPSIIVFTKCTRDVMNAVRFASKKNFEIRIRSGRQSYEAYSSAENAVIIDVSSMKEIYIDKYLGIAHIQAGVTNLELANALDKAGLAFSCGSCQEASVVGMALGGGIGMLSRFRGLTCDNLLGLEMVDANGNILIATETCNSDLLWACRGGGGGNFGVVTALTIRVFPASEVTVFRLSWNFNQMMRVLNTWQFFAPTADYRLGSELIFRSEKSGLPISASGVYFGNETLLRQTITPLLTTAQPISFRIASMPVNNAFNILTAAPPFAGQYFKNSSAFAIKPFPPSACQDLCSFLACVNSQSFAVQLVALGGVVTGSPPSSTAFCHRNALFILQYSAFWNDPTLAAAHIRQVEALRRKLLPFTAGAYVNYPDQLIKNYDYSYYGANLPRLRYVKTKYDPADFFQFRQSILPFRNKKST